MFVEIEVGPPESGAQPAEILTGTCDSLGPVAHELENVIGGYSLTEIPGLSLADVATGNMAVNLHQSFANFDLNTTCGVIPPIE